MKIYYNFDGTKENFLAKILFEIKQYNQKAVVPLKLKHKNDVLIITTDSILSRGIYPYFKAIIKDDCQQIVGVLRMSVFGRVLSVLLIYGLIINFPEMQIDFGLLLLFVIILFFFGKYFVLRKNLKSFIKNFIEDFNTKVSEEPF